MSHIEHSIWVFAVVCAKQNALEGDSVKIRQNSLIIYLRELDQSISECVNCLEHTKKPGNGDTTIGTRYTVVFLAND